MPISPAQRVIDADLMEAQRRVAAGDPLTDEEIVAVVNRGVELRREAIAKAAAKGIRKEHDLVGLLRRYAPEAAQGKPMPSIT